MPEDSPLTTHFQTLDEVYHAQEIREGIDQDPRYWQIVDELEQKSKDTNHADLSTFERAKNEFAARYPEDVTRMREDAMLVTAHSIDDPTYKRLISQQTQINQLANVTSTPESLRQQVIQRMVSDHPGKTAHYSGTEPQFVKAITEFLQHNPEVISDPQLAKKYAPYTEIGEAPSSPAASQGTLGPQAMKRDEITTKLQALKDQAPLSPMEQATARIRQAGEGTTPPLAGESGEQRNARVVLEKIDRATPHRLSGESLEQYSARMKLEHIKRVADLKASAAASSSLIIPSSTGRQKSAQSQNPPTSPPPRRGSKLKSFTGNALGSIYMLFNAVGKPAHSEPRTSLREQYAYVGNSIMTRLPLLKSQASNWRAITAVYQRKFPELSQIRSSSSLMAWMAAHKGALPNPGAAMQAVRAFEEYYSYFPEGGTSEALQSRLRVEMQNEYLDQQAQEGAGAGSHSGGGGTPASHALNEEQEEKNKTPETTTTTEKAEPPQASPSPVQASASEEAVPSQPSSSPQTLRQTFSPWKGRLAAPGRILSSGTRSAVAKGANSIPRLASRIPNPLGGLPFIRGAGGATGAASKARVIIAGAGLIGPGGAFAVVGIILFILIFSMAFSTDAGDADVQVEASADPAFEANTGSVEGAKTVRGEVLQDSIGDGTDVTGDTNTNTDDSIGNNNDDTSGEVDIGSYKPARYTITVRVTGSASDVEVTLPLDKKAELSLASTPCEYKKGAGPNGKDLIVWHLAQRPSPTTLGRCANQPASTQGTQTTPPPSPSGTQSPTQAPQSSAFPLSTFQSYGFPAPQNPNPQQMSGDTLQRWNSYIKPLAQKAAAATGVDVGIIGMWPWLEGSFIPFDNCDQELNLGPGGDGNHNTQCHYWGGEWQVGLGLHPADTHQFLKDAFDAMYGNHDTATVQRVGQSVISNMKSRYGVNLTIVPSTFPNESIDNIISGALRSDLRMRNLLTTLMKDEAIGVYMIARHFRDNKGLDSGLASEMEGWSSTYYNRQKIVNYIRGIYDAGVTGGSTPGGSTGGRITGVHTLTVSLLPKPDVDNDIVVGYATAEMIDPQSSSGTTPTSNSDDTSGETDIGNPSDPSLSCSMASPVPYPWPLVNRWNALILQAIQLARQTEGVEVSGNVVKAIMMMESGGEELAPNMSDHRGLMQVSEKTPKTDGSNCDWHKPQYNVNTTQGNLNCGVQHLARGLKTCNRQMAAVIGQYFTGKCNYSNSGPDGFGTTPNVYVNKVIGTYNYLNSVSAACK